MFPAIKVFLCESFLGTFPEGSLKVNAEKNLQNQNVPYSYTKKPSENPYKTFPKSSLTFTQNIFIKPLGNISLRFSGGTQPLRGEVLNLEGYLFNCLFLKTEMHNVCLISQTMKLVLSLEFFLTVLLTSVS